MNSLLRRTVVSLVRCWTAVYTWRMPESNRAARRAEIESDLWESQHSDQSRDWLTAHIATRLVLGLLDDLRWRAEHDRHARRFFQVALKTAGLAIAIGALLWLTLPLMSVNPPNPPPRAVLARDRKGLPVPPPPPPPLCNPPGIGLPLISPCTP